MASRLSGDRFNGNRFNTIRKRRLLIETLESRALLAFVGPGLSIEEAGVNLRGRLSGATVITHGFQPGADGTVLSADGDSLRPLANAIQTRVSTPVASGGLGGSAYIVDYDVVSEGGSGVIDVGQSNFPTATGPAKGELILLWDWAVESNELTSGWTSASGDALAATLVKLGAVDPASGTTVPLHFISHSFGAA